MRPRRSADCWPWGRPARLPPHAVIAPRLVLLGTAGGPAWVDGARCGVSSVVVHGNRVYLVDLGHGAMHRLVQSGLGEGDGLGSALSAVRGIFLTHLHSDHAADWPTMYATGPTNIVRRGTGPIQVRTAAQHGCSGKLVVGEDLLTLGVGRR